ncbi:hypothetical protein FRX31_031062 [Thalictrum thalictroides]|uniref:CCHC-type domain-containing protein n=1 Tax=Thalictrum thalictroides TaxID=46969 RepID=A0A7J6V4M6_THATH|nr:hypothetical protein FRX31_031062 [Thalictrum thalictroides]
MENQLRELTTSITTSLTLPNQTMRLQIPVAMLRENGNQWNHSLIFTLLDGGHHNPNHVMRTVKIKWKITEVCDMVRVGHNRFICRFSNVNDQERIEEQQPWVVMGSLILMETFSTEMVAANITFERLPLWMSFRGLELEHMQSDTVRLIGETAGIITNVLPIGVIPRTAEGFRALVNVNVTEPLVQGRFVNTLSNGDVWVAFRYNNLPTLFCSNCNRLGHTRNQCHFPHAPELPTTHQPPNQTPPITEGRIQTRELILWPHEQAHAEYPAKSVVGKKIEHKPEDVQEMNLGPDPMDFNCTQPGPNTRLVSLIPSEVAFSAIPTGAYSGNVDSSPTAIQCNPTPQHLHLHQNQNIPNTFTPDPYPRRQQQPLRIQEPLPESTPPQQPPRRGRGRPLGSTNKNRKLDPKDKGKGKQLSDEAQSKTIKNKKRKIFNTESASSATPYIPHPPPQFTPRRNTSINMPFGNIDNLDLISQMYANPILTNLLIQQGALNSRVLQTLASHITDPFIHQPSISPLWNPSSPNSTLQGPYHNYIEELAYEPHLLNSTVLNLNQTSPIITSPDNEGIHVTHSPSGGLEFGTMYAPEFNLGVQTGRSTESSIFASPVVSDINNQV